jgi:hypothetical protein
VLFFWTRKLLFVHVYKTGGTSVAQALYSRLSLPERMFYVSGQYANERGITPLSCWRFQNLRPHITAREIRAVMPRSLFENCFKFAFVRNPWSLQVSLYHYVRNSPDHPQHAQFTEFQNFPAYVDWLATRPNGAHTVQCDFVMDEHGKPLVNFIGRFENLAKDFAAVAARFGWSGGLPHLNSSGTDPDFRRYYTPRARDLIAELHAADIDAFGYNF